MPFRYCVISNTYILVCAVSLYSTTGFSYPMSLTTSYSKQMLRSAAQTFVVKTQKNYRVILCRTVIAIVFVALNIVVLLPLSCDYHDVS
jgi:hypothetical protein